MSDLSTLIKQIDILTEQVNTINEFLNIGEEKTEIEASNFDDWSPKKQEDFFEVLATGAQRYGGGNGKNIC